MQFLKKEAVLLALAPALGMLGVYAYESGRYRFLKVPSMLIDLPVNRLLMGGVAIAVLVTMLLLLIDLLVEWIVGRSRFESFIVMFVVFYIFAGLPSLLYSSTRQGALCSLIIPILLALNTFLGLASSKKKSDDDARKVLPWIPDAIFFAIFALLTSWLISGFGFWAEKLGGRRLCYEDSLVAGTYRDSLILKAIPPAGGRLDGAVKLVQADNVKLRDCAPEIIGGTGISIGEREGEKSDEPEKK